MVSELFIKLNQVNTEIAQAGFGSEVDHLNMLDEQYTKAWKAIYSYQPDSYDESKTMVLHLLNQMADCAQNGEDFKNIRMKILDLFSQQTWYQQQYQSYGT